MLKLTEAARHYIKGALKDKQSEAFSVQVIKGGCSGMQYKFECREGDAENYECIDFQDFKIYIKKDSVLYIVGTQLDYEQTSISGKLVFKNPNIKGECGCGKSFNI